MEKIPLSRLTPTDDSRHRAARSYAPGPSDGFGDRLLMYDDGGTGGALELLSFHPAIADAPGFEDALHERVRALGQFTDEAFSVVCAVERIKPDGALALVTAHPAGQLLSSTLPKAPGRTGLHPAFVTWIVRELIQPLSVLQAQGDDITHSALTADRIVLTSGGRVRITEHVLGSALRQLGLSRGRLWSDFGLVAPNGSLNLDARADVFQVGVLALSMLLGRQVTPAELELQLAALLTEWSSAATARSHSSAEPLRRWLERALQVGDAPYRTAAEALGDLLELPSASASHALEHLRAETADRVAKFTMTQPAAPSHEEPRVTHGASAANQAGDTQRPVVSPYPAGADASDVMGPGHQAWTNLRASVGRAAGTETAEPSTRPVPMTARFKGMTGRWRLPAALPFGSRSVVGTLAAIALVEAVVIGILLTRPQAEAQAAATTASSVDLAPLDLAGLETTSAPGAANLLDTTAEARRDVVDQDEDSAAIARAASGQRSGAVRISAPIELTVLRGDRVLGSTADGPIVAQEGTHQLELINTPLGFRAQQAVTFRAGEITALTIQVPAGRISINAQPWAEVWIDNRAVGETPLANLTIPLGEHEIVFRHPELGERRQNVIVRADASARVSTTFDR